MVVKRRWSPDCGRKLLLLGLLLSLCSFGISIVCILPISPKVITVSGRELWRNLLINHGYVVKSDASRVVAVHIGRDHHEYITASRSDVDREFNEAIKAFIPKLMEWMARDQAQWGRIVDDRLSRELSILTGEHFGTDVSAWQNWWLTQERTFVGKPDAYERLKTSRRHASQIGRLDYVDGEQYWANRYEVEVERFPGRLIWWGVCAGLAGAATVTFSLLLRRRYALHCVPAGPAFPVAHVKNRPEC